MRRLLVAGLIGVSVGGCAAESAPEGAEVAAATGGHLNPMIDLHEAGEPVFGLYAPRPRPRGSRDAATPPPPRTPTELARMTLAHDASDFIFDGSMERGMDESLATFEAYVAALGEAGASARTYPLVVKMYEIAPDPAQAAIDIDRQLDAGVSGVMFVGVESAEEVRQGLAAMRFVSNGGTRPEDDVGAAPAYWGVSEAEYREEADLWPLNPEGELINWTIVESREGLANVREIAAVPGIGVLWPGAGTLRGVFSSEGPDGERVFDEEGWEAAIQTVLAACNEFDVPCGYPAGPDDIEMRMEQGFDVFVMGWGEDGFRTIEIGNAAAAAP